MKIQFNLKLFLLLALEIFVMYYTNRSINQYTRDLLYSILYIVLIKYLENLVYRLNSQHKPDYGIHKAKRLCMRGGSNK